MLVERLLERSAECWPEKVALVCAGTRYTYQWLDRAANRLAHELRSRGLRRGDRVVIQIENGVDAIVALFGTLKAGGVFVLVNPTVKAAKLGYILADCEASVLVADARSRPETDRGLADVPSVKLLLLTSDEARRQTRDNGIDVASFDAVIEGDGPIDKPSPVSIDVDLAALIYTSGSTGKPKGVMLSHANILAAAESIDGYLSNTADDVILDVLPLSFDYGLYQVFLAFKSGARLVLERSFVYPTIMLDLMASERVTALPIVPMMAALLVRQELGAYDLSSLRYITNTGAALPPAHITSLRSQLPQVRIFSMYGLTECKRVSYLSPDQLDARPASVGKAMDNVEVYLVDEDGGRLNCGVGQLVVRGSNVMQGYWRAPEDTARVLRRCPSTGERLLHTGDIFRIDAEGYMYFQGRTDDVIKSRGQKVSPREIEAALHELPAVCEAVVVGVSDPILGEAVKGYVTLHPGASATELEILQHCSKHLEDFMVPRSIEILTELPHNSSGKLARKAMMASGA